MLKKTLLTVMTTTILATSLQAAPVLEPASGSGSGSGSGEGLLMPTTPAGEQHDQKASAELADKLQNIKTLSASFAQTSQGARGRMQVESGEMLIKRPNQFRWDVTKPFSQQIISRDDKVWMIDPDVFQVVIKRQDDTMGPTPVQLLSGDAKAFLEDYRVVRVNFDSEQTYTLRPRGGSDLFEQLDVNFRQNHLSSIVLKDNLGGMRRISFSDVRVNGSIDDSRFKAEYPKDFDVIDETRS